MKLYDGTSESALEMLGYFMGIRWHATGQIDFKENILLVVGPSSPEVWRAALAGGAKVTPDGAAAIGVFPISALKDFGIDPEPHDGLGLYIVSENNEQHCFAFDFSEAEAMVAKSVKENGS